MERTLMQDVDAAFYRYAYKPLMKWTGIEWLVNHVIRFLRCR